MTTTTENKFISFQFTADNFPSIQTLELTSRYADISFSDFTFTGDKRKFAVALNAVFGDFWNHDDVIGSYDSEQSAFYTGQICKDPEDENGLVAVFGSLSAPVFVTRKGIKIGDTDLKVEYVAVKETIMIKSKATDVLLPKLKVTFTDVRYLDNVYDGVMYLACRYAKDDILTVGSELEKFFLAGNQAAIAAKLLKPASGGGFVTLSALAQTFLHLNRSLPRIEIPIVDFVLNPPDQFGDSVDIIIPANTIPLAVDKKGYRSEYPGKVRLNANKGKATAYQCLKNVLECDDPEIKTEGLEMYRGATLVISGYNPSDPSWYPMHSIKIRSADPAFAFPDLTLQFAELTGSSEAEMKRTHLVGDDPSLGANEFSQDEDDFSDDDRFGVTEGSQYPVF